MSGRVGLALMLVANVVLVAVCFVWLTMLGVGQ